MMKLVLLSLALMGFALGDDAVNKPQGALLVLPQQYNPTAAQQVQQDEAETLDRVNERIMERLRQEQGSQTGNYHVYLEDGRLQKVQYTAAPLRTLQSSGSQRAANYNTYYVNQQSARSQASAPSEQYNQLKPSAQQSQYNPGTSYSRPSAEKLSEPNPVVAHFGRLQQERLQQQLQQLQQQQEQLRQQAETVQQQLQQQKDFSSNFVASIQFSEVPPIPAPIYSNSPAPLTRILRQTL